MARIRSIKPDFFTSEQVVSVSIPARYLFEGMWVFGDDDGLIADSPLQLKMKVFPGDNVNVSQLVGELVEVGLVERVDSDQGPLLRVPSFLNHQSPKYPTPTKYTVDGASLTQHSPKPSPILPERSRSVPPGEEREERRGERGEEVDSAKRGSRIPEPFIITDDMRSWAKGEAPLVDLDKKTVEFVDYWAAIPGKGGVKLDWVRTWKNDMRKKQEFAVRDRKQRGGGTDWALRM